METCESQVCLWSWGTVMSWLVAALGWKEPGSGLYVPGRWGPDARCLGYNRKQAALLSCICVLLLSARWAQVEPAVWAWSKGPWFQLITYSSKKMCSVHSPMWWPLPIYPPGKFQGHPAVSYNLWFNIQDKVLCIYFARMFAFGLILPLLLISSFDTFSPRKRCLFLFKATPRI